MATSPIALIVTAPPLLTDAIAGSLALHSASPVTSRVSGAFSA
jgi:hypothetical protein